MLSLNNVLSASALLLLLTACGTKSPEKDSEASQNPKIETSTEGSETFAPISEGKPSDAQAGIVLVVGADGQAAIACSYSVNGKTLEGKTQEECDLLKKEFEKATDLDSSVLPTAPSAEKTPAASGESQVACAFNINGKLFEGKSQIECDQLKKDLRITLSVPSLPSPAPALSSSQNPASESNVTCAFNINGKLHEGKSQAECDKLKNDLGFQF